MWNDQEADQARDLLMQFNGAREVCAVLGCDESDLDALCLDAFGLGFDDSKEKFASMGRAMLRKELMTQALNGNPKALDMLAREQLGMGPVEVRARSMESAAQDDGERGEVTPLAAIFAMYRGGLPASED